MSPPLWSVAAYLLCEAVSVCEATRQCWWPCWGRESHCSPTAALRTVPVPPDRPPPGLLGPVLPHCPGQPFHHGNS